VVEEKSENSENNEIEKEEETVKDPEMLQMEAMAAMGFPCDFGVTKRRKI
jgi:hypothetical protein